MAIKILMKKLSGLRGDSECPLVSLPNARTKGKLRQELIFHLTNAVADDG